ncbi:copper-binding protein [Variovorax sp. J31P179]|jgi:Cu(I)/Ag(I) efflux system protein CusF|uniref:copper-binding protein n=1 Tax=Variovorax sp. J31P179 TaxID=3053508 RepID=UPI0025772F14|nr:copper-binding protein [Variovorax sp. J31P179]MDM0083391.1 copper-binding protein [Variovorax sp. J31P179]
MTHALRNLALAALLALAATGAGAAGSHADNPELSDGEIRKIDPDSAKLTIRHGPLKDLDMPGMTMVFQVRDSAMLGKVQVGDKVRFRAERIGGRLTVTEIESVH